MLAFTYKNVVVDLGRIKEICRVICLDTDYLVPSKRQVYFNNLMKSNNIRAMLNVISGAISVWYEMERFAKLPSYMMIDWGIWDKDGDSFYSDVQMKLLTVKAIEKISPSVWSDKSDLLDAIECIIYEISELDKAN